MINKEEWINLINLKIKDIAKEYGIREDQVDYLASVHTEPDIYIVIYVFG